MLNPAYATVGRSGGRSRSPGSRTAGRQRSRSVTLAVYASAILENAAALDDIVVAHSFAGVSAPRVLRELAGRIGHVVFLAAVVPPYGTRVLDQIDRTMRIFVEQ